VATFFHYYKKPTFLSFSPTSGGVAGGYDVNITGTNFANFDSYMYCMFGEQPAIATYVSNTTVQCTAPGGMGSVHLTYSQNNQQFDSVGTFTYVAPMTSDTVYLSFLQVGLIAGGALLLVLILIAVGLYVNCSKRQYTVLRSVGPDGEAEEQTINVAQIQLLARIGKGSFAEVFRATWRGSEIAVKKLPARAVDEEMRADFEGEAALMSRLRHPNCLQYLGSCNVPPDIWILTEYMPLGSLYQVLHDVDLQLNWDVLLSMLNDTAKGVAYLHGHEPTILHRDLKSHNILVNEHWVAKVCDFGLSRLAVESHTMTACGTPCWTAPEVLRNQRYCFAARDHQLLTNRGFMFLDEVLDAVDSRVLANGAIVVRDWRGLQFAGYSAGRDQIVYEQPTALIVNAPDVDGSAPPLVGFARRSEARRWDATLADAYGRRRRRRRRRRLEQCQSRRDSRALDVYSQW
jgi:tRNA A-37 threonylcarbamoyl transferase component Bud32